VPTIGPHFARCIKRERSVAADKWHLDKVVLPVNGVKMWLWRAVDGSGGVLDILAQPRRDAKAAKRFLKHLIARSGQPCVIITDKLCSYIKPILHLAPDTGRHAHKAINNGIESSHRPPRSWAGSSRQGRRSVSFPHMTRSIRYSDPAAISYRHARSDAFDLWQSYTSEMTA